MLQQGGSIKIKGNTFQIIREDTQHRNNKGEVESPFIKSLEEQFIKKIFRILNYI